MEVFIDGNFSTGAACEHHCSPTCHPGQIGPDWRFGCTHKAWPGNRGGDFVPLVDCGGDPAKCEIPIKFLRTMINGRRRRISNAHKKIEAFEAEIIELKSLIKIRIEAVRK